MSKRLYGVGILVFIWYMLSIAVGIRVIPYPHDVLITTFDLYYQGITELIIETVRKLIDDPNFGKGITDQFTDQGILKHLLASLRRLLIGLLIAIIIGLHMGLLLGLSKRSNQVITPIINTIYPIPKAALLPILIILLGIGDLTKISLIILIVIFPIILNIKNAVELIPKESFYVARTIGLNNRELYKEVILPAIMPSLLTSIRIGIGTSIAVLYLSETFATQEGLGYYLNRYLAVNNLKMFVGLLSLSMIGAVLFTFVSNLEKKFCKWL